jgi:hypothetical protein
LATTPDSHIWSSGTGTGREALLGAKPNICRLLAGPCWMDSLSPCFISYGTHTTLFNRLPRRPGPIRATTDIGSVPPYNLRFLTLVRITVQISVLSRRASEPVALLFTAFPWCRISTAFFGLLDNGHPFDYGEGPSCLLSVVTVVGGIWRCACQERDDRHN